MKKLEFIGKELKLAGITSRTNNILEMNPTTSKITPTLQKYFNNNLASEIHNNKQPGVTYCVYTDYENDLTGDYTYFVSEEVLSFDHLNSDLETLVVPIQKYAKFTVGPGKMPDVCIGAWQNIWKMTSSDFGSDRAYVADFEVYDERSQDNQNTELDIYIGIKQPWV